MTTICIHSFRTKKKLKLHKNVRKNHDNCHLKMPQEFNKILKYNQSQKSMMIPFIIYGKTESLLEKIQTCQNNPEKSFTTKVTTHTACDYSIFT